MPLRTFQCDCVTVQRFNAFQAIQFSILHYQFSISHIAKMCDKYLHADGYQDDATQQFRFQSATNALTESHTEQMAQHTKQKRAQANHHKWQSQLTDCMIARHSQGDAYGQCVDARCHSQYDACPQVCRVEMMSLFLFTESIANHPSAQKDQQSEGYPMVISFDMLLC